METPGSLWAKVGNSSQLKYGHCYEEPQRYCDLKFMVFTHELG